MLDDHGNDDMPPQYGHIRHGPAHLNPNIT